MSDLKELKQMLASLDTKFQEIKSSMPSESENDKKWAGMYDYLHQSMRGMRDYVYGLENQMYKHMDEHKKGHLPPIIGADKMNKALKALGCDGDYNVVKPNLYAHASRKGMVFEASLDFKKKD